MTPASSFEEGQSKISSGTVPNRLDPKTFRPMEARTAETLPEGADWRYEPKWDGFRCLAFRDGKTIDLRSKSGQPLGRYFPDIVAVLAALPVSRFVLDGELVIWVDGTLSFDTLQLRLHPAASRVRALVAEHRAQYIVFDLLVGPDGTPLLDQPLKERRAALERFIGKVGESEFLRLSPTTDDPAEARRWPTEFGASLDGIVAKRADEAYRPDERTMVKVKRQRTADCVVGGFRYGQKTKVVGSLLLGLYDAEGKLNHVGFTSNIKVAERPTLTKRLESLIEPPGFTGDKPGGPSRWSNERSVDWQPLRPELVVEVGFDHVSGGRFRHGTRLIRWRPDKAPEQCTCEQMAPPTRAAELASPGKRR
jgi:ATP-dependent DNA ligase